MSTDRRLEVLGWQGEPQFTVDAPRHAYELRPQAIEQPAFQLPELPRRWDDPEREPDEDVRVALDARFKRLSRGLGASGISSSGSQRSVARPPTLPAVSTTSEVR
jgi:hypothetical protein